MIRRRDFLRAAATVALAVPAAIIGSKLGNADRPTAARITVQEIGGGREVSWSTTDIELAPKVGSTIYIERDYAYGDVERFRARVTKNESI